jgi:hypothetical protein
VKISKDIKQAFILGAVSFVGGLVAKKVCKFVAKKANEYLDNSLKEPEQISDCNINYNEVKVEGQCEEDKPCSDYRND